MDIYGETHIGLQVVEMLKSGTLQGYRSENDAKSMIQNPNTSNHIIDLDGSTISVLLERLGIQDNSQNQGMILLALLQGFPLNEKNINFFIGKRFKTPFFYRILEEKGIESGYSHEVRELRQLFPRLETLAAFIKNIDKNIELIQRHTSELCKLLLKDNNNLKIKNFIGDLYSGMLLQLNNNLPFHMIQIPLIIKDDIYHSEVWVDKEKDMVYLEFTLPNLKTIGCLFEDWMTSLELTFYCQREFERIIEDRFIFIEEILKKLGFKYKSIKVSNIDRENGLLLFLSRFVGQHKIIDISI